MSADAPALESAPLMDRSREAVGVETFKYDNHIVRAFAIATAVWGLVGTLAGLFAACQLFWPGLNLDTPFTTFGRIRPLHTNAVIFAFVGNGMFCGIYYSLQRLCKARMFSDLLSWINFWGWQAIIVARPDHQQRVRRAGVAHRHCHRRGLGRLHGESHGHNSEAP
jgi:cytochrome c oxidase cbb3-type subunit I/II